MCAGLKNDSQRGLVGMAVTKHLTVGWAGLSAKETGRIGGLMGRENRAAPPAVPVPFAVPKPLTVPDPPDSQATKEGE